MFKGYATPSYAQDGIDAILSKIFQNTKKGFYVDVGANHPFWTSNTYIFYKKGWKGINIDATPGSMKLFRLIRPRDINLELAISDSTQNMTFFMYDSSAINRFSKANTENNKIIKKINIMPKRLGNVLDVHLPKGEEITLLDIDVEGHDLEVLKSNNWKKFTPKVIVIELNHQNLEDIQRSAIYSYLVKKGYRFVAASPSNVIFIHKSFKPPTTSI